MSSGGWPVQHLLAALLLLAATCATQGRAYSITNEPVRVTDKNSGPRYDIDEVERTRIPDDIHQRHYLMRQPEADDSSSSSSSSSDDERPVGHISIRRIFLVPMSPPTESADSSSPLSFWPQRSGSFGQPTGAGNEVSSHRDRFSMFSGADRPFWNGPSPFMRRPHLFGEDEASKGPQTPASSGVPEQPEAATREGERETSAASGSSAVIGRTAAGEFDPMQLMVELLRQALNQAILTGPARAPGDQQPEEPLAKEASTGNPPAAGNDKRRAEEPSLISGLQSGAKPASNNETREDVVEIEGKKYLRKTVINRHVGENLIFMTKRLIFVPLNETTETGSTTTVQPPAAPVATEVPAVTETPVAVSSSTTQVAAEAASSTTTTTTTTEKPAEETTTQAATSSASPVDKAPNSTEQFVTTQASAPVESTGNPVNGAGERETREETTTNEPKMSPSLADAVSDIINKAAERLVNKESDAPASETVSSTSAKPL